MQTKRFLLSAIILLFCALALYAAEKHFPQRLAWKADKYALEYKVEIQTADGKKVQTLTTEESAVEVSLPAGSYRYRVTAIDILERDAAVSDWTAFEIFVAAAPTIQPPAPQAPLSEDGSSLVLDIAVGSVTAGTTVELVNTATGKTVRGTLVLSGGAGVAQAGSETEQATKAQFKNVGEGSWKMRVTNPSGLSSESKAFAVKDVVKEKRLAEEAAAKAEKERLAAEKAQAEQAEKERIAEEKQRIAEEKQREAEEKERLAAEKRAAEEAEKERIAQEKAAEKAERERLAKEKEEAEREERERTWTENKNVQLLFGAGYALFAGDSALASYTDTMQSPSLNLKLSYIPIELDFGGRVGMELSASAFQLAKSAEYYETALTFGFVQAQLVYQQPLVRRRLYVSAKAGAGLNLVQKSVSYNGSFAGRENPEDAVFGSATAQGGLSLFWIMARHFVVEAGADVSCLFATDMPPVLVNPYLCVGLRL